MITPIPLSFHDGKGGSIAADGSAPDRAIMLRLVEGAIIFDIDETLLEVTVDRIKNRRFEETLANSHVLPVVAELLIKEFQLCAITGNDLTKFEHRFIEPLRDHLAALGQVIALTRLEVYGNGAATHLTFAADGAAIPDQAYNDRARIPEGDHRIIIDVLTEVAEWAAERYLLREAMAPVYDLSSWAYKYDTTTRRWLACEGSEVHSIPYVSARGNRAMVTLKPLPSQKHIQVTGQTDIREQVLTEVQNRLSVALGARYRRYAVQAGGWSSIDVTLGISKATAVEHYLAQHELEPEQVVYLANEFRPGGNDQPVLDGIPRIQAICINQPIEEVFYLSNVVWGGGRGVHSAEHQLADLLERFEAAMLAVRLRPTDPETSVPVIREKLLDAYEQKINDRQRLLDRLVARTHPAQIDLRREMVCLLDRTLLRLQRDLRAGTHDAPESNTAVRPNAPGSVTSLVRDERIRATAADRISADAVAP